MSNPRSLEAWYGLDPERMSARDRTIVSVIARYQEQGRGGATTYEIEVETGIKHQSCSAAVSNMWHKKRWLRPSGITRPTDTGRRADVMEIGDPLAPGAPVQPGVGAPDSGGSTGPVLLRPEGPYEQRRLLG